MLKRRWAVRTSPLLLIFLIASVLPASASDPALARGVFSRIAIAPELRNPSVALLDANTGEIVFESNAYSQRKPASTLKIISAASALRYFEPEKRFSTSVSLSTISGALVIIGENDPWISLDHREAVKMKRTSLPYLAFNGLSAIKKKAGKKPRKLKIYYSGINPTDVSNLKKFYAKRHIAAIMKKVDSGKANSLARKEVVTSTSPSVGEMVQFFLTWSDNLLADRIAKLAAKEAGFSMDDNGVTQVFTSVLQSMNIDPSKLIVKDGSGVSRENKLTAHLLGELLFKVHQDSHFAMLIDGLPVSGETGTLRHRYIDTAPEAVGLVKAKTGTLSGTVSLAGYIQSGNHEYVFVVIADRIQRTYRASDRARKTLDRYLAKISEPLALLETQTAISDLQTP